MRVIWKFITLHHHPTQCLAWTTSKGKGKSSGNNEDGALVSLEVAAKLFSLGNCIWWLEKWAELKKSLTCNKTYSSGMFSFQSYQTWKEPSPQKTTSAQEFQVAKTPPKPKTTFLSFFIPFLEVLAWVYTRWKYSPIGCWCYSLQYIQIYCRDVEFLLPSWLFQYGTQFSVLFNEYYIGF